MIVYKILDIINPSVRVHSSKTLFSHGIRLNVPYNHYQQNIEICYRDYQYIRQYKDAENKDSKLSSSQNGKNHKLIGTSVSSIGRAPNDTVLFE
jgi:hypothetical protein